MESTEKFLIGNLLEVSRFPARNVPVREFNSARTISFPFGEDNLLPFSEGQAVSPNRHASRGLGERHGRWLAREGGHWSP